MSQLIWSGLVARILDSLNAGNGGGTKTLVHFILQLDGATVLEQNNLFSTKSYNGMQHFRSPNYALQKGKSHSISKNEQVLIIVGVQLRRRLQRKSKSLVRPLWNGIQTNPSSNIQRSVSDDNDDDWNILGEVIVKVWVKLWIAKSIFENKSEMRDLEKSAWKVKRNHCKKSRGNLCNWTQYKGIIWTRWAAVSLKWR